MTDFDTQTLIRIESKVDAILNHLAPSPAAAVAPEPTPEPQKPVLDPNRKFGGNWAFLTEECDRALGYLVVQGFEAPDGYGNRHQKVLGNLSRGGVLTRRDTAYLAYAISERGVRGLAAVNKVFVACTGYLVAANAKAAESGCGPVTVGLYLL